MTPDQKKLARHALGLPNKSKRSYRNYFMAGVGTDNFETWKTMEAEGYAEQSSREEKVFWLTRDGAKAALEGKERLCPEDFPEQTDTPGMEV